MPSGASSLRSSLDVDTDGGRFEGDSVLPTRYDNDGGAGGRSGEQEGSQDRYHDQNDPGENEMSQDSLSDEEASRITPSNTLMNINNMATLRARHDGGSDMNYEMRSSAVISPSRGGGGGMGRYDEYIREDWEGGEEEEAEEMINSKEMTPSADAAIRKKNGNEKVHAWEIHVR